MTKRKYSIEIEYNKQRCLLVSVAAYQRGKKSTITALFGDNLDRLLKGAAAAISAEEGKSDES